MITVYIQPSAVYDEYVMEAIEIRASLEEFCKRRHIRRLSLFGSAVRGELRPDSDIDLLIESDPRFRPRLNELPEIEDELSALYGRAQG
jgi:predicted nucleotidyltransferase